MSVRAKEAQRLEGLWAGEFGNAYTERNAHAGEGREKFWHMLLQKFPVQSVLEVGCNIGVNLQWIAEYVPPMHLYGVDINTAALHTLRQRLPDVNAFLAVARDLPFRDAWFDLVFTAGVLIHQPGESVREVMAEVVRCSRRFVLCMEYAAEETTEVPYRGQTGALFKRPYSRLYQEWFPGLQLRAEGFLPREEGGWDDVTYWLFAKA